jgi:hypothetical protein
MEPTMPSPPAPPALSAEAIPNLTERLEVWVAEGVISRTEADAITAFESGRDSRARVRRVTPATEALAYLGAALAIAAGGTVLGGEWEGLSTAGRIAVPGVIWLALFAVGWRIRDAVSPPLVRLARVLWFLSAASLAWSVAVLVDDGFGSEGRWVPLWSGAAIVVYGGTLYLARPATLQQLALVGGLFLLAVGLAEGYDSTTGFAVWAIGVAWVVLGWRRLLVQPEAASTVGSLMVLLGALLVSSEDEEVGTWLSVLSSAGLIGASVGLRHTGVLVLGAIGLFLSIFGTIQQYVEGTTGIAIGLLVAGVIVLALAIAVARLDPSRWRAGHEPR